MFSDLATFFHHHQIPRFRLPSLLPWPDSIALRSIRDTIVTQSIGGGGGGGVLGGARPPPILSASHPPRGCYPWITACEDFMPNCYTSRSSSTACVRTGRHTIYKDGGAPVAAGTLSVAASRPGTINQG
ncbi:hypothetical protein SEVIR_3G342766v4 [Setaria viridis]